MLENDFKLMNRLARLNEVLDKHAARLDDCAAMQHAEPQTFRCDPAILEQLIAKLAEVQDLICDVEMSIDVTMR
jgi:hypothetical protein